MNTDTDARFNPFHAGETEAQRLAGVHISHAPMRPFMPDQHRAFFAQLPYVLIAALDQAGSPHATMLTGEPGFLGSPTSTSLVVRPHPNAGDPFRYLLAPGRRVGLLGIELPTRRRNRANGVVEAIVDGGWIINVTQSFGNCPQYIHRRDIEDVETDSAAKPEILASLDEEARQSIASAETMFVASTAGIENGGVDISHRGGRAGFVELHGDELLIPEFPGNNYFNTIGNFIVDPRAALLFVDFATGTLLELTGRVRLDWTPDRAPAGARFVWHFTLERGIRRRNAIPYRWSLRDLSPSLARTGSWP